MENFKGTPIISDADKMTLYIFIFSWAYLKEVHSCLLSEHDIISFWFCFWFCICFLGEAVHNLQYRSNPQKL